MKLINLYIQNKNKFLSGITLDFSPNIKRKDNEEDMIQDGLLTTLGIFGKNASGKTTILNNIISYFYLIDKNTLKKIESEAIEKPYREMSWQSIERILGATIVEDTKMSKTDEMVNNELSYDPKFVANFKLSNGKEIAHEIIVKKIGEVFNINEKLKINNQIYEINPMNHEGRSSIFQNFMSKVINDASPLNEEETKEFTDYIINSISNLYISNSRWSVEINSKLKKWMKNNEIEKIDELSKYSKIIDPNLIRFKFKDAMDRFVAVIDFMGEKKEVNLDSLSSGTRSTILYYIRLINIGSSKAGGLIIHDEIEGRVHNEIAKRMIKGLKWYEFNAQLIFTSHSPQTFDLWFRQDAAYAIENNHNIIKLHNVANKFKQRHDKKISSIFNEEEWLNP